MFRAIISLVATLVVSSLAAAQQPAIKRVPIQHTSPASGQEMYIHYCASCHGKDAKGKGPAAPALKVAPTDLTTIAKRNGGKFPTLHVFNSISGEIDIPAHGSKDMPVWGYVFRVASSSRVSEVQQRLANLTDYIRSLQEK